MKGVCSYAQGARKSIVKIIKIIKIRMICGLLSTLFYVNDRKFRRKFFVNCLSWQQRIDL